VPDLASAPLQFGPGFAMFDRRDWNPKMAVANGAGFARGLYPVWVGWFAFPPKIFMRG